MKYISKSLFILFSFSFLITISSGASFELVEDEQNSFSVPYEVSVTEHREFNDCEWSAGPATWDPEEGFEAVGGDWTLKPGKAYFAIMEEGCEVDFDGDPDRSVFNLIAGEQNSFSVPYEVSATEHEEFKDINWKAGPATWDPEEGFEAVGGDWTLKPGKAYFALIENDQSESITLDEDSGTGEEEDSEIEEGEDSEISEGKLRSGFEIYFEELQTGEKLMSTNEDYPKELELEEDGIGSMESDSIEGEFKVERHEENWGWNWEMTNVRDGSRTSISTGEDTLPLEGYGNSFEVGAGGFNEIEDAVFIAEIDISDGESEVERREFEIKPSENNKNDEEREEIDESEKEETDLEFEAGISEIRSAPDHGLDEGVIEVHYSVSNTGSESRYDMEFDLGGTKVFEAETLDIEGTEVREIEIEFEHYDVEEDNTLEMEVRNLDSGGSLTDSEEFEDPFR